MNLNKCYLGGRLVRDPELKFTPSNTAVCMFGIAINRQWKDGNGEKKEEVVFLDIEAWGRTAEVINQYFRKGSNIFLECRAKLEQWEDKEGNKRRAIKFVAESFQFIDGKGGGEQQEERPAPAPRSAPAPRPQTQGAFANKAHEPVDGDNIPFNHDAFQL